MKALLFDLDDTLYPEKTFVEGGFNAVARYLSERAIPFETAHSRMRELLETHGRGHIFDQILREYHMESPETISTLVWIYRTHQPQIQLDPSVADLLTKWRTQGFLLGLITDGMASVQHRKIDALGLQAYMDVILCTDELGPGHGKPSLRPFQVVLDRLRVQPSQALYVGDNEAKDFEGGNRLGMTTIQLLKHRSSHRTGLSVLASAGHKICELAELESILMKESHASH